MNRSPESRTGVAALHPWPFGPPLRGRAPHSDGGQRAARSLGAPPQRDTATAGSLAYYHLSYSVQ